MCREHLAGQRVQDDLRLISGVHELKTILLERRRDPDRAGIDEGHGRFAGSDSLADGKLEIGDDAVAGCGYGRAGEVEVSPLECGERFPQVGIVLAGGAEFLPRLGKIGLGAGHRGVGGLKRRLGLVFLGARIDPSFNQFHGPLRLIADVVAVCRDFDKARLGRVRPPPSTRR